MESHRTRFIATSSAEIGPVAAETLVPRSERSRRWLTALLRNRRRQGRIEVCGGIGAGKSTVAATIAKAWGLRLVRETYEEIPFWSKYYREPTEYELEKNVSFLLAHGDAIRSGLRGAPHDRPVLFDFALFQDLAYADLSSSEADAQAVEMLHDRLTDRFGGPSLLLHVHCPVGIQLNRIRLRGRAPEAEIGEAFLRALSLRIEDRVQRLRTRLPVIDIDTEALDFVDDPGDSVRTVGERLRARIAELSAAL